MLAEISAGLSSLKAAFDLAKGLNAASAQADINEVKITLQEHIFSAQQALAAANEAQTAAAQRVRELEQEIVRLKDWSAEQQRYELKAIGERAVAYAEKQGVTDPKAPHWLCQPCFDGGHKAALQFSGMANPGGNSGLMASWDCGRCKARVWTERYAHPGDPERQ